MGRVWITGGLGQVGSGLVERLSREGYEVIVIDNYSNPCRFPVGVEIVRKDVRETEGFESLFGEGDIVIHTAAQVSVARSLEDPCFDAVEGRRPEAGEAKLRLWNNVLGTVNLLDASLKRGVSRFVYFSSAAVYGEPVYLPVDEKHPTSPLSPYGAGKLAGEIYTRLYQGMGLPTTILRPFNIYSPHQNPRNPYSGVISIFLERARDNLPLQVHGDGEQTRDFIYLDDVIEMVELVLNNTIAVGKTYNVATGIPTTINSLAQTILELTGKQHQIEHTPPRPGDIKHSHANITQAKKELGYHPQTTLKTGLKQLLL